MIDSYSYNAKHVRLGNSYKSTKLFWSFRRDDSLTCWLLSGGPYATQTLQIEPDSLRPILSKPFPSLRLLLSLYKELLQYMTP